MNLEHRLMNILQQRIKRAKELLKENQSIKEVALELVFRHNHFIKTFKTFEGLTQKLSRIYFQNIKSFLK